MAIKKKAAARKRTVAKKTRARAMTTPTSPRKKAKTGGTQAPHDYSQLDRAVTITEDNLVIQVDAGFGDVFQLVEFVEKKGNYSINRSTAWEAHPDGSFTVTEYRLLTSGHVRLSEALRVMAAEIDRVDLDPKRAAKTIGKAA